MNFARVTEKLLSVLPEWRERYKSAFAGWWGGGGQPGPYVVFGFVVTPALKELLPTHDGPAELVRAFEFFERMARSSDIEVVNLLAISVFEWLLDDPVLLATAWDLMGPETKEVARRMAHILRCERNLPKDGL